MATTRTEIVVADGWVELVATGEDTFLVENAGSTPVRFTYADTAPGASAPFHTLGPGQSMVRLASGALYGAAGNKAVPSAVVVSV